MGRLLATLAVIVLLLSALDRIILLAPMPPPDVQSIDGQRHETFSQMITMQFNELRANLDRLMTTAHARWQTVPDRKGPRELRIVLIGNSAAQFSLVPRIVEERIAAAFPDRDVHVIPLIVAGLRVVDEEVLVRAALAKEPDVVVLTPNLKGLMEGSSGASDRVRILFETARHQWRAGPAALIAALLDRYWRLYRERDNFRARLGAALTRRFLETDALGQQHEEVSAAFAAIATAAARGDMRALVETYKMRGMSTLLGGAAYRDRLSDSSPVFGTLTQLAAEVSDGHALGIAIFMPVNPIFRDATATAGFDDFHLDDPYIQALAARTLGIYRSAGFMTFNRIDALPASAFIDLVHVNADGMEMFSREMATSLAEALQAALPAAGAAAAASQVRR